MIIYRAVAIIALLVSTVNAYATTITIGDLSSNADGSTSVISDNSRGIEYLRFNLLDRSLNYGGTIAAVQPGGQFDGWKIADKTIASHFIDALLGTNNCSTSPSSYSDCTGTNVMTAVEYGQLTGGYIYHRLGFTGISYLTTDPFDVTWPIGIIRPAPRVDPVVSFTVGPVTDVLTYDRMNVYYQESPFPFMLYRDIANSQVPEPGSLALVGFALAGLFGTRQRYGRRRI